MKTSAQHTHADGTVCWWDLGMQSWWTYGDDTLPTACPNPRAGRQTIGSRTDLLVGADAPHEPEATT